MGTLFLDQVKKQASYFLQEKYKSARLALTDVTEAELLAEDATNNDPSGPSARTMTQIAEASYDVDDYWRVIDVLHRRLQKIDQKQWRQSYKTLVLLDFLLTHGPEEFANEFECDVAVIEELANFQHIDEKGFNWGTNMQKKAHQILKLLGDEETRKEARLKALKVTKEIRGFGSCTSSPTSLSCTSFNSDTLRSSSLGSTSTSSTWYDASELSSPRRELSYSQGGIRGDIAIDFFSKANNWSHQWDQERFNEAEFLLDPEDEYQDQTGNLVGEICSRLSGLSPLRGKGAEIEKVRFRSLSDAAKMKKFERQFSLGY